MVFGNQILVLQINNGQSDTQQGTHIGREATRCINHMFGDYRSFFSDYLPFATGQGVNFKDPVESTDFSSFRTGQLSQGHGYRGWVYMTIIRGADDDSGFVKVSPRMQILSFSLTDDIKFTGDVFSATFEISEPLFFQPTVTYADTPGLVKAGLLTGFLRQNFIVQAD